MGHQFYELNVKGLPLVDGGLRFQLPKAEKCATCGVIRRDGVIDVDSIHHQHGHLDGWIPGGENVRRIAENCLA